MSATLAPEPAVVAVSEADLHQFKTAGFFIARHLLARAETETLNEHFMRMHAGRVKDLPPPVTLANGTVDPLSLYPRIMHPHRFDELSKRYMLDPRIFSILRQLLGEEVLSAQSMTYFKAPGSRGQALHQDNFYLQAAPSTCIAAWVALDDCDAENGALMAVPNTQNYAVQCPTQANADVSFTKEFVAPPKGYKPTLLTMNAGDTLFFNGNVIHGSGPNKSQTQFRRSFICHYIGESAKEISQYYHPLLNEAGQEVARLKSQGGGPCGVEIKGPH